MNQIEELLKRVLTSLLVDMVISGARGGSDFIKIKVRPVMIRDSLYFQVSRYTDKQVFHENMMAEDALEALSGWILHDFRQAQIRMQDEMVTVLVSKASWSAAWAEERRNGSAFYDRSGRYDRKREDYPYTL